VQKTRWPAGHPSGACKNVPRRVSTREGKQPRSINKQRRKRRASDRLDLSSLDTTCTTSLSMRRSVSTGCKKDKDIILIGVGSTSGTAAARHTHLGSSRVSSSQRIAMAQQHNHCNQLPHSQQCVLDAEMVTVLSSESSSSTQQQLDRQMQSCSGTRDSAAAVESTTSQQQHELTAVITSNCTAGPAATGTGNTSSSSSSGGASSGSCADDGDDEGRGLQQFERKPSRGSNSCHRMQSSGGACADRIRPGRWVAGEHIGRGSFGSVCKAMNTDTGVEFAVKEIFISAVSAHGAGLEALTREIEVMRGLRHCNIVRYLGFEVS
jgi:Protein kinase domain